MRVCVQAVSAHPNVMGLRRVAPSAALPRSSAPGASSADPRQVLLLELEFCAGGELFDFVLKVCPAI